MNRIIAMILGLLVSGLYFPASASARDIERFVLNFNDTVYQAGPRQPAKIFIKRELAARYPYLDRSRLHLKKVILLGKTRHGRGSVQLRVGHDVSERCQVPGSPYGFQDPSRRSFSKTRLHNPAYGSDGPWQLLLAGNFVVRKVIVVTEPIYYRHSSNRKYSSPAQPYQGDRHRGYYSIFGHYDYRNW